MNNCLEKGFASESGIGFSGSSLFPAPLWEPTPLASGLLAECVESLI
jgi:hypothetical protein